MIQLLCLPALLASPQDTLPGQARGVPSTHAPQPVDIRFEERPLHDDEEGGCVQLLLAGAGQPEAGSVLVWRDLREAHLGLYLQLLAPDGSRIGADRSVLGHRTTRMTRPALGLASDGSGCVAWVFPVGQRYEVHARFWDARGEWLGKDFGLETRQAGRRSDRPGRPDEFDVAVAPLPAGGALIAWRDGGLLKAQRFNRRGRATSRIQLLARGATGAVAAAADGHTPRVAYELDGGVKVLSLAGEEWIAPGGVLSKPIDQVLPPAPGGARAPGPEGLTLGALSAWTADDDVWARIADQDPFRVNTDQASSRQDHVALASHGDQAVSVWEDDRAGATSLMWRRIDGAGGFGPERLLATGAGPRWPALALAPDGRVAVAWKERDGGVRAQVLGPDDQPLGASIALDPEQRVQGNDPPAIVALEGGFLVLWCRKDGAPQVRRLDLRGNPVGSARALAKGGASCGRPDLAARPDGKVIAAWDARDGRGSSRVLVRLLDSDGAPLARAAVMPAPRDNSWDPSLAVNSDGRALVAWCEGAQSDRSRDVLAQRLDLRARQEGALLPITVRMREQDFPEAAALAGGDFVVAWEGDLPGHDHTFARRVGAGGELGAPIGLNPHGMPGPETRTRPVVVGWGEGLLSAWSDRHRRRHLDVFVRGLGPGFDALPGR